MTTQAILAKLSGGAKSYSQLKSIPGVDHVLRLLLRSKIIVLYPAVGNHPARYMLPLVANDGPLKPRPVLALPKKIIYGDTKQCRDCGETKRINSFGWYGKRRARKPCCHSCVWQRKKLRESAPERSATRSAN